VTSADALGGGEHRFEATNNDRLESPLLRGLSIDDLFDIVARYGLHFDQSRQSGVVFHMISCLTSTDRWGSPGGRHQSTGRRDVPTGRADPPGGGTHTAFKETALPP
jgi:hypothetical protein